MEINLEKIDNVTKILLILLVVALSYFIFFLALRPFFISQPSSMAYMMSRMTGGSAAETSVSLIALIIALVIGIIISFYLFKTSEKQSREYAEFNIIKKVLSEDEKKILDEVKKAKEITQDSLRFRLGWSKAKISTILTNLDRKGIIQRQRIGKTYKVYLQKFAK